MRELLYMALETRKNCPCLSSSSLLLSSLLNGFRGLRRYAGWALRATANCLFNTNSRSYNAWRLRGLRRYMGCALRAVVTLTQHQLPGPAAPYGFGGLRRSTGYRGLRRSTASGACGARRLPGPAALDGFRGLRRSTGCALRAMGNHLLNTNPRACGAIWAVRFALW